MPTNGFQRSKQSTAFGRFDQLLEVLDISKEVRISRTDCPDLEMNIAEADHKFNKIKSV